MTLLIVTHELDALEDVVTRIVCIRDGRVVLRRDAGRVGRRTSRRTRTAHGHHHDSADPHLGPAGTGTYPAPLDPTWREADRV